MTLLTSIRVNTVATDIRSHTKFETVSLPKNAPVEIIHVSKPSIYIVTFLYPVHSGSSVQIEQC